MTPAALDAIRARDAASSHEHMRAGSAGRDRRYLLAALDRAEAVVAAIGKANDDLLNDEMSDLEYGHMQSQFRDFARHVRAILRAYKEGASRGA